jgi:hypothetical protein
MNHHLPFLSLALALPLAAQWQLQSPTTSPSNRSGLAMAGQPNGPVLLFGGSAPLLPSNETWSWDGSDWTQLQPATSPGGRTLPAMVFDGARNRFVMFGGWLTAISVGTASNQTWEFDGTDWTQVNTATTPTGAWKHGMAFDSVRGRTVMYGGAANGFPIANANTWEYDGVNWVQALTPSAGPGPRERVAMCFHTALNRTLLFGGINPQSGGNDDTWAWNGTTWTLLPVTSVRPSARTGASLVYHAPRGVAVLHGGTAPQTGTALDDTWEFDGVAWTPVAFASNPTAARDFGCAFDGPRDGFVRFGGLSGGTANAETWTLGPRVTAIGPGCAGTAGIPDLRSVSGPHLGSGWQLQLGNLVPAVPFGVFVVSLTVLPPTSLAAIGMPGCDAHVAPDILAIGAASGGTAQWSGPLPNDLLLLGIDLAVQGLSLDAGANAAGLVAANALRGTLGY